MTPQQSERLTGRLLLAVLLAGALVLALRTPLAPGQSVLRPDTGTMARSLSEDALRQVLSELLHRVYAAFGEEEEFAIYDGIATAVAEDLVTELYLQRRATQDAEYSDGGRTEILELELLSFEKRDETEKGYAVDVKWLVTGQVGHEDHQHLRTNAYAAMLTVGPAEGEWKLTDFDLTAVLRQESEPLFFGASE